jgi:hypothetical protein
VFAEFKCFRMLYSQKRGRTGPCSPSREASRSCRTTWWASTRRRSSRLLTKINVGVLERYNQEVGVDAGKRRKTPCRHTTRVAVEGGSVKGGTRDDALGVPLTAHELECLTSVYREDHPGAEIRTTLQVATDVFTIHFRIQ